MQMITAKTAIYSLNIRFIMAYKSSLLSGKGDDGESARENETENGGERHRVKRIKRKFSFTQNVLSK